MNEEQLGSIGRSVEVQAMVAKLRSMKSASDRINEMTEFLRKNYISTYKMLGKVQYGEMVADAKIILQKLGIIKPEKERPRWVEKTNFKAK